MNWGNRLLFTFIVFASGMGYLVYRSMHVNFELVEKDYYKSELKYQDVIDGTNRVNGLSEGVKLNQNEKGVFLQLPAEMKDKVISGNVWFYCAYDQNKDRQLPLNLTPEASQQFSAADIGPGRYTVKVTWSSDDKKYFSEKKLLVTK